MTRTTEHHDTGDGLVQPAATGGGALFVERSASSRWVGPLEQVAYGPAPDPSMYAVALWLGIDKSPVHRALTCERPAA